MLTVAEAWGRPAGGHYDELSKWADQQAAGARLAHDRDGGGPGSGVQCTGTRGAGSADSRCANNRDSRAGQCSGSRNVAA